jgi:xanthine dehydrogenase C subunit
MAINEPARQLEPCLWQPKRVDEAIELKRMLGFDAIYAAGGTLLQTDWESGLQPLPKHLISLEGIDRLKGIYETVRGERYSLAVGSLTSLATCIRHQTLAGSLLSQACREIAAPSVRNRGTIGGNVLSISGDALPALLVLEAECVWQNGKKQEIQPLEEWLKLQKQASFKEERLLLSLQFTERRPDDNKVFSYCEKVGRREAFTPSLVTVATNGSLNAEGSIREIRIAVGGGKAIPHRLRELEEMLTGVMPDEDMWLQTHELIRREYQAGHDSFGTSAYRKQAAANLLVAALMDICSSE